MLGLSNVIAPVLAGEKRKLQQRLARDTRLFGGESPFPQANKAIRRKIELTGWSGKLVLLPGMARIHRSLEQAWPRFSLAGFVATVVGITVFGFLFAWAILNSTLVATGIALCLGFLPILILNNRRNARQQLLAEQLPDALDFLGRILRAGHSLSTGLQMIGQELPDPLASEFRRAYDAHSLGLSLDESLKDTAARIESTDFGFFVTAMLIQRQTGGDLSEVLEHIAQMIRNRIRLQHHVRAKTAEGRLTGYILTAFPVLMFMISYTLNPAYAGMLLRGTGLYFLAVSGGLCIIGLFAIRKITTFKV